MACILGYDPRRRIAGKQFIETSLAALATEHESTTFRYALAQVSTTAWHYTAPADRAEVVEHVAAELFKLAQAAEAGSDEQFQLITAYLGYGEPGDAAFEANAKGLLDGSVKLDGLEIDNNFRWTIINALSAINAIGQSDIDAELAKRETTENREFALGARAVAGIAEARNGSLERGFAQRRADQHAVGIRGPWFRINSTCRLG